MEKALDMWPSIKAKIDAGEDPKKVPTTVDIPAFYNIKYKTFCHRINGRTAAKGHARGGARRGRVFTVGTCGNSYERAHQSLYFKHYLQLPVLLSRTRFMQDHHIFKQNYFPLWLHNRIYCSHHYNLSQVLDQPRLVFRMCQQSARY